ncbi:peroxisomal membrane protein 4 [Mrakia frigida]|uniref:Tim17/Tim22/Tim23/Pmp24 family protein n=1 Tax=Mrakia frigida TaxID=29902 RepID=UPI003FCC0B38
MDALESFVASPAAHDLLAIVKGARNGLVYGVKIRFPHALVMALLFHKGDWKAKATFVLKATKSHALNLMKFVTAYKTLMLLQRKVNGGKERSLDTFVAGALGGYMTFGERTAVNEQIVLYVASRVLASFLPRASPVPPRPSVASGQPAGPIRPVPPAAVPFSLFASVAWGMVMWVFRNRGETLQGGLVNSMSYLYVDSDHWKNLKTLLWHNK